MRKSINRAPKRPQSEQTNKLGPAFSFSARPEIKNYRRADGTAHVYILVRVDGVKRRVPTEVRVKPRQWSDTKLEVMAAHPRSQEYNMILRQMLAAANDIAVRYRLQGRALTAQAMVHELSNGRAAFDFIRYMEIEITKRKEELSPRTYAHHITTLGKMKDCFPYGLTMGDFNHEAIENFRRYMKARKLKGNTITGNLKRLHVYARRAQIAGVLGDNPFANTSLTYRHGDRIALTPDELQRVKEMYESDSLAEGYRATLQCFIFSCYTGLRIGDLDQVCKRNIVNGELVLLPQKSKHLDKVVRIPLSESARRYMNDTDPERRFFPPAEATMNRHLKQMATITGINKPVTYHTSRHTFATLFLEAGGDVTVLQQLMGHEDLATTMIYVHITDARKREQVEFMK